MVGLLLLVISLVVLAGLLRAWLGREDLSHLPYRRQDYLLSRAERTLFEVLCRAAGDRFYICPKVRLADVLSVPAGTTRWYARFNRIAMKRPLSLMWSGSQPMCLRFRAARRSAVWVRAGYKFVTSGCPMT